MSRFEPEQEVFMKMTHDEQMELAMLSCGGTITWDEENNWTVMMGAAAFNRLEEFVTKMNKKYGLA